MLLEWNWLARLAQGSDSGYQTHDGKAEWMHNKKPRTSKQNPITIIIIIIIPIRSFTRETCSQAKERHTCKEKNFLKILHITRLLDVQVYAGSLYVLLLQYLKIFMFIYFYRYLCLCHLRGGQRNRGTCKIPCSWSYRCYESLGMGDRRSSTKTLGSHLSIER